MSFLDKKTANILYLYKNLRLLWKEAFIHSRLEEIFLLKMDIRVFQCISLSGEGLGLSIWNSSGRIRFGWVSTDERTVFCFHFSLISVGSNPYPVQRSPKSSPVPSTRGGIWKKIKRLSITPGLRVLHQPVYQPSKNVFLFIVLSIQKQNYPPKVSNPPVKISRKKLMLW